ncbi:phage tail tip lysozyme [Burkholderia cepacia]|uniref:phage tail tip lysozyme n=1 Tax=Burkholderia cepacia TaxID=292 RepID=UPI001F42A1E5|nr:phage tail tip lysozyme [Burkholderia cepacia]MCE4125372.1 phage tail tip lysozyme [Burkholderia cepacia]
MATIVDALVVTLGFDLSAFKRGKAEAGSATKKLTAEERAAAKEIEERNKKAAESFRSIRNEVLALVAIFTAGVGIKQFAESTINSAVNLGYMAQNLQMSTRDLAAWQRAAERAGGSAEGITAALQASQNDVSKLKFGQVTEGVQWFLRMGGSVKDLKDGNSYLLTRARIISSMFKTDPGRARFIAQQMGIGDGEFNFLKQGESAVLALVDAQKKNSAVTEQQAAQALKLKNEWLDLRDRLTYVGTTVLLELMPAFEQLIAQLQKMADWVADHKADISEWVRGAVTDIRSIVKIANSAADAMGGWKNVIAALIGLKIVSILSPLLRLGAALAGVGTGLGSVGAAGPAALSVLGRVIGAAALLFHSENLNEGEGDIRTTQPGDTWNGDPVGKARAAANNGSLNDRRRYLMGRLKEAGYTDAQAAGITGSLQQESQLDPNAVNKTSGAAGIAQWLGPRAREFEKQFGHPVAQSTFGEQVDFMLWELKNTEKQADQRIRMAKTPEFAAEVHAREYERPGANEINVARRQQYAREAAADGAGQGAAVETTGDAQRANALKIAQQTATAAAPAVSNSTSSSTTSNETNINGPITVHTQATDAAGIARDIGGAMKRYGFVVPQANTGLS